MKPRFTVLTLLGLTAYVATLIAAVYMPHSPGRHAWTLAWLVSVAWLVALAFNPTDATRFVFGRSALVCGACYLVIPLVVPGINYGGLPDTWITSWLTGQSSGTYLIVAPVIQLTASLLFGLCGGWFALRIYGRMERRAKQEQPGNV